MLRHPADRRSLALSLGLFPLVPALVLIQPNLLPWLVPLLIYASYMSGVLTHYQGHNPVFVSRTLNDVYSSWLSAFYGFPALAWVPTHNQNHHRYVNALGDAAPTGPVSRDGLWTAISYPSRSSRGQLPLLLAYARELRRRDTRRFALLVAQISSVIALQVAIATIAIALHGWRMGLGIYGAVGLLPALFAPWVMMFTNYLQHIGCEANSVDDHSRNFVGRLQNRLVLNAGYHTVHHEQPHAHWTEYPALHAERAARIAPHLNQQGIVQFCVDRYLRGRTSRAERKSESSASAAGAAGATAAS